MGGGADGHGSLHAEGCGARVPESGQQAAADVDPHRAGGFEVLFARCAKEFAKPIPPDMSRIVAISAEHGIHFVN